eukprot:NODE_966_length_2851_cov_0.209302.p3 type:complete len:109 gc:universal NODE_966_length_2851_cov_0.209302:924-598(-)
MILSEHVLKMRMHSPSIQLYLYLCGWAFEGKGYPLKSLNLRNKRVDNLFDLLKCLPLYTVMSKKLVDSVLVSKVNLSDVDIEFIFCLKLFNSSIVPLKIKNISSIYLL